MPKDLKAELIHLSENPSITKKLMELAEEAADRVIEAEEDYRELNEISVVQADFIKQLKEQNAALREENEQIKLLNQQLLEYIAPADGCECPGCAEARNKH